MKEADALRSYIYARRHFGSGEIIIHTHHHTYTPPYIHTHHHTYTPPYVHTTTTIHTYTPPYVHTTTTIHTYTCVAGLCIGIAGGGGSGPPNVSRRVSAPAVGRNMSPAVITSPASGPSSRQTERAREVLGQGVASQMKTDYLQDESPHNIIHMIRLMLSCLHAWRLDQELDDSCEQVLGLVRPAKPVSFGLLSKGGCMSLVLPGWGLRTRLHRSDSTPQQPTSDPELSLDNAVALADSSSSCSSPGAGVMTYTFDQKYHLRWQLSRALTTQHLLTMVSITNTLMNQSIGAHQLASSSAIRQRVTSHEEDSDSDGDDQTVWDNQIRAVWSRVRLSVCLSVHLSYNLIHIGGCSALCDAS